MHSCHSGALTAQADMPPKPSKDRTGPGGQPHIRQSRPASPPTLRDAPCVNRDTSQVQRTLPDTSAHMAWPCGDGDHTSVCRVCSAYIQAPTAVERDAVADAHTRTHSPNTKNNFTDDATRMFELKPDAWRINTAGLQEASAPHQHCRTSGHTHACAAGDANRTQTA